MDRVSSIAENGRKTSSRRRRGGEGGGIREDCISFLGIVAKYKSMVDGQIAHHHILKYGMDYRDQSPFIHNLLLQMYAQCGCLDHSSSVLAQIPSPDQYSWSFIIKAYAHHRKTHQVFQFYHQMQCVGMIPDRFIHVSVLSSCFRPSSLVDGKRIHTHVICSLSTIDSVLGTSLVNMYGKCGDLRNAERVLGCMCERDLVAWNSMIALYDQYGMTEKALNLFGQMVQNEVNPDDYTFVNLISICTMNIDVLRKDGRLIHNQVVQSQVESRMDMGNAIINMYIKHGFIEEAKKTFDDMHAQNVVSWTTIISGYFLHGYKAKALSLLDRMTWEGFLPDNVMFVSILSSLDDLNQGKRIHALNMDTELKETNAKVGNALLSMYINCNSLHDAKRLFDGMPSKEVVTWTTMMEGFAQHGQINCTLELLDQMQVEGVEQDKIVFVSMLSSCMGHSALADGKRIHVRINSCGFESDVTVGNALINMYRRCGEPIKDALILFLSMNNWNSVSYISIISACGERTCLQEGKWLHFCIIDSEPTLDNVVINALLTMYGKCGCLTDARALFATTTCQRNLALWNAMIGAYAQSGQGKEALQLFRQMQEEKVKPNESTFVSVLFACSHTGLLDEGYKHLVSMYHDYGIKVEVDHYNCMIDLLARVGRLDEAENMINTMPCESTDVSWMALLSACRDQGDLERGERAADRVSSLEKI